MEGHALTSTCSPSPQGLHVLSGLHRPPPVSSTRGIGVWSTSLPGVERGTGQMSISGRDLPGPTPSGEAVAAVNPETVFGGCVCTSHPTPLATLLASLSRHRGHDASGCLEHVFSLLSTLSPLISINYSIGCHLLQSHPAGILVGPHCCLAEQTSQELRGPPCGHCASTHTCPGGSQSSALCTPPCGGNRGYLTKCSGTHRLRQK